MTEEEKEKKKKAMSRKKSKIRKEIREIEDFKNVEGLSKNIHNRVLKEMINEVFIEENIDALLLIMRDDLLKENRK